MSPTRNGSTAGRELAWLLLLTLGITLPFVTQAFHIDDPTFIAIARQIARDPWRPYSFSINWLGAERPAFAILANPPLVPAYIALVTRVVGESEVGLHAAFVPLALLAAWGAWRCAGCFVRHRATAAALFVVTPAFVVSSHTLMPDVALMALVSHAVASCVGGLRDRDSRQVAVGAALSGLACLTRYNGVILIPLLAWAWWLHRRGNERRLAWIGLPVAMLALWTGHNIWVYGSPHFLAAASVQGLLGGAVWGVAKGLATASYLGGAALFPLAPVVIAGAERALRGGLVWSGAAAISLALVAGSLYGQSVPATMGIAVLLVACGVYLTAAVRPARQVPPGTMWRGAGGPAADALFLAAWLAGGLLFNQMLLFAAVRYLLPVILPAILLLVRVAEESPTAHRRLPWLRGAGVVTLGLSIGLSVGDTKFAEAERAFAESLETARDLPAGTRWFVGHWGFQYYMERAGARALGATDDSPRSGDLVVISRYADPHRIRQDVIDRFVLVRIVEAPSRWPFRTLTFRVPGFFHANTARVPVPMTPFIFLPYGLSTEPLDRFHLYRVTPGGAVQ